MLGIFMKCQHHEHAVSRSQQVTFQQQDALPAGNAGVVLGLTKA
jgi:vancomycin permeability regulator SanA